MSQQRLSKFLRALSIAIEMASGVAAMRQVAKDVADRIIIERALEVFKLHPRDDDGGQGKE